MRLDDLRFADVLTFLSVQRWSSITGAARALKVTPSQVSKAMARLESQLGVTLLTRSARGVQVSNAGKRILPQLEEIAGRLRRLRRDGPQESEKLTLAAPSYLTGQFLPHMALRLPSLRMRGLELPPALIRAYAAENFFDLALTIGEEKLPATWVTVKVGETRRALFGPPAMVQALGRQPVAVEKIRELPFVCPIYNLNGQFVPVDDGCPLGYGERVLGHEAQTIGVGLQLAAGTRQVIYGPVIAARPYLDRGDLAEIAVRGWEGRDPLHVACNGERVLARTQREIVAALKERLAALDPA